MNIEFIKSLPIRARVGIACGIVVILAVVIAAAMWLLRANDSVLFADLRPQDAALMAAELDRQKVAYRVSEDGSTILVDAAIVHATRMKLLGKDLPLGGASGFELFNNGDFGMTEFAQKINYQRALQGEITRTILSLAEVREARVHLALPEESLFKRAADKPKASITLALKAGQVLRADQVNGIQRLVAGAVPGITAQDVTIVDQQGVALTRVSGADAEADTAGAARLDLKRDMEKLLARKATEVLERAFGAGQASASVDVTLNMDQVRVTTEDVVGAPAQAGHAPSGIVVKEREVLRDAAPPLSPDASRTGNSQREVEYQVGRRIEQVVKQPGAIGRMHVAAVIRKPLDVSQIESARALLTAAVGAVEQRGDVVVVQSQAVFEVAVLPPESGMTAASAPVTRNVTRTSTRPGVEWNLPLAAGLGIAALLGMMAIAFTPRRNRAASVQPMTPAERRLAAAQLKAWLDQDSALVSGPTPALRAIPEEPR